MPTCNHDLTADNFKLTLLSATSARITIEDLHSSAQGSLAYLGDPGGPMQASFRLDHAGGSDPDGGAVSATFAFGGYPVGCFVGNQLEVWKIWIQQEEGIVQKVQVT